MEVWKYNLLLAGEDAGVAAPQIDYLQARGFSVRTVSNQGALQRVILSNRCDALILHYHTSHLAGSDLCRHVRGHAPELPVIIVVPAGQPELVRLYRRAGASEIVLGREVQDLLHEAVCRVLNVRARQCGRVTVVFSVRSEPDSKQTLGRAFELSEGGLGLEVNRPYEIGSPLSMRFLLPGASREVSVSGTVRWHRELDGDRHAIGVQFRDVDKSYRRIIRAYLTKTTCPAHG